ncbi:brachyurin-like [Cydia pomonella]|uniref:brachyurin-like n=1 Tax=Cydia pomonella TaxID=82600 RepID=UPI002ADD58C2|nr:brachyurin-like [Cydia pomonella]
MVVCFNDIFRDISSVVNMAVPEFFNLLVLFIATCNSAMEGFIEGGAYAKIESFPHSVYLYMICEEHQVCGGSILTQNIILTAGHCFEHCFVRQKEISAYAGSENTNEMLVAESIINFRIHKDYDTRALFNDIAVGFLKSELPLGDTMKRVIIAKSFPGVRMAKTAGWGAIDDNTLEQAQKLKMVVQIVQSYTTCTEVTRLRAGMMCAKNSEMNHPSHGDSGSALMARNGQQIGLVSFRTPSRREVVIYTNVSYYFDWIEEQTRNLYCSD